MKAAQLALLVVVSAFSLDTLAQNMMSDNYGISWSVNDGGGGLKNSLNYTLNDSVSQLSSPQTSISAGYALAGGFFAAPDTDTDRVRDFMDNCTLDFNPTQYDSNNDGYGNLCDPDLNNNGFANFADYALMTAAIFSTPGSPNWNADADLDGSNVVNFLDLLRFQFFFLQAPGPSGLVP